MDLDQIRLIIQDIERISLGGKPLPCELPLPPLPGKRNKTKEREWEHYGTTTISQIGARFQRLLEIINPDQADFPPIPDSFPGKVYDALLELWRAAKSPHFQAALINGEGSCFPPSVPKRKALEVLQEILGAIENQGAPAVPSVEYCLLPGWEVRWRGTAKVRPQQWHLIRLVLGSLEKPLPLENASDIWGGDVSDKRRRNTLSEVNEILSDLHFDFELGLQGNYIIQKPL